MKQSKFGDIICNIRLKDVITLHNKPSEIKLNNIFDAIDESVKTVQCKKESKKSCNGKSSKCVTHDLWNDLETHINSFFEQKSL